MICRYALEGKLAGLLTKSGFLCLHDGYSRTCIEEMYLRKGDSYAYLVPVEQVWEGKSPPSPTPPECLALAQG